MNLSKLKIEGEVSPPPPQHTRFKTGSVVLSETSQNGYGILRKETASDFSAENIHPFILYDGKG